MLKLIRIFVLAAYSLDEVEGGSSVFDVIELVKSKSHTGDDHGEVQQETLEDPNNNNEYKTP